ncbi:AICARFT IMPCHas superfamily incomplete domain containing protein [Pandoravirus celtis]|uniref:AICARFT IMPCHas superfamily incomplete domain containing protein n=1 Tax=Pandoravirus celtis TaxID=2568002 RepID=A0A4D6EFJ3_9VIRU|nr:AICARFT IMPCHas superfamily incomplete domain containing protein [Pandoravirus celtis]
MNSLPAPTAGGSPDGTQPIAPDLTTLAEIPGSRISSVGATALRYGENPHQRGAFVGDLSRVITPIAVNPAKPHLSYSNLLDVDAAIALMADFLSDGPTAAVLKHGIPCALASATTMAAAWQRAIAVDPLSPYSGVAVFNAPLDADTAALVAHLYLDVVLAPGYAEGVVQLLPRKTLLRVNTWDLTPITVRGALGGLLVHERDTAAVNDLGADDVRDKGDDVDKRSSVRRWKVVTQTKPDLDQTLDLLYAERACKHVKSNAVVLVKDRRMIAAGAAQPCRVGAVEVALMRAHNYPRPALDLVGMVMASDACFPFPDGPSKAIAGGVVAIVQPGGSRRGDKPSIAVCDEAGVAMVFTGMRHFRH